jgi:biotin carboxyl carrier protein
MFADETIIINEDDDFELKVLEIIHEISMNLFKDASDSEYEILKGAEHAPMPDPEGNVKSTMYGMIVKINVNVGDEVNEGDVIYIIEAMKMENDVKTDISGKVTEILMSEGDTVEKGTVLMVIE